MKVDEITFGEKLNHVNLKCEPRDFVEKVVRISKYLGISPHWLMVVMELETAGTFSPAITNELGYTGLIQFGDLAASDLNTNTDKLRRMDALQQLDYVQAYLQPYRGKMKRLLDVYLAVFFPVAVGKKSDFVLKTKRLKASRVAKWNPGFDLNKDQQIEVSEIEQKLLHRVPDHHLQKVA